MGISGPAPEHDELDGDHHDLAKADHDDSADHDRERDGPDDDGDDPGDDDHPALPGSAGCAADHDLPAADASAADHRGHDRGRRTDAALTI